MAYDGFGMLGGTELFNASRTAAYVRKNLPSFPLTNECEDCEDLADALGDEQYESPLVDNAPWVDASNPATYGFYGLMPIEIVGLEGSTRTAAVTESIGDGGFVGRVRHATRQFRVSAMMVAENENALAAGLTWLSAALNPQACASHGGSCGGATFCYYSACPTVDDECFLDQSIRSATFDLGTVNPSSPSILSLPEDRGAYRVSFKFPDAEGFIFRYGRMAKGSPGVIEEFGPVVSRRVNYLRNPRFGAQNLSGWTVTDRDAEFYSTGASDGGSFARFRRKNVATNPYFDQTEVGSTNVRTNLAISPDPGAANSLYGSRWSGGGNNTTVVTRSTTNGALWGGFLMKEWTAVDTASGGDAGLQTSNVLAERWPVTAGSTIEVIGHMSANGAYPARVGVAFFTAAGAAVGGNTWSTNPDVMLNAGTGFQEVRGTFTVPATATAAVFLFSNLTAATYSVGRWIRLSSVHIEVKGVTPAVPFYGGQAAAGDFTYAYADTPNRSVSFQVGKRVAGNPPVTGQTALYLSTDSPPPGQTTFARARFISTGNTGINPVDALSIPANRQHESTMLVRASSNLTIQPRYRSSTGATSNAGNPVTLVANQWTEITRSDAPAFAGQLGFLILGAQAAAGIGVTFDMAFHAERDLTTMGVLRSEALPTPFGDLSATIEVRNRESDMQAIVFATADDSILSFTALAASGTDEWRKLQLGTQFGRDTYVMIVGTGEFDVSRTLVEHGSTVMPYFDGGTAPAVAVAGFPNPEEYTARWSGVPHASRAILRWNGDPGSSDSEQVVAFDEQCDPDWRPYMISEAGTLSGGTWWYSVRLLKPYEDQVEPYERSLHDVTAIEGPSVVEELNIRSGGVARIVDFVLVAGTPFSFSTTREILPRTPMAQLPTVPWVDPTFVDLPLIPILDPDCPPIPAPPRPPQIVDTCIEDVAVWQRYWLTIPAEEVSAWSQMLPSVTLTTQAQDVRQVRVRFFPNPFSYPIVADSLRNLSTNPSGLTNATGVTVDVSGTTTAVGRTTALAALPAWTSSAYLLSAGTAGGAGAYMGLQHIVDVTAGKSYGATAFVAPSVAANAKAYIQWLNAANAVIATTTGDDTPVAAGAVATPWVWGTAPAGAVRARFIPRAVAAFPAGATVRIATMTVAASSSTPFAPFDGFRPDAAGYFYGWTGADGASPSVKASSGVDPNSFCSEFILSYLPANSTLTVDGTVRSAFASVQGGEAQAASNLLYGTDGVPMTWPELSCGTSYLVAIDVPPAEVNNISVQLELTRQE